MMVSFNDRKWLNNGRLYFDGVCLSSDTKPTDNIENGSVLMEMDTGTMYIFDAENSVWRAWV